MTDKIVELFGYSVEERPRKGWPQQVREQHCPYLGKTCIKVRKSQPDVAIGTCTVNYGQAAKPVIICPHRLLERRQIFSDCLHLLSLHQPGNEIHVVPEVGVPGGSVDYFLVSARKRTPIDFVGIELQTLDTTGTVWPARQRFLSSVGVRVKRDALRSTRPFGMNWKMTAKTILVQLHHKLETFAHLSKHLVLVLQDCLIDYMRREFEFAHVAEARLGDPLQVHSYAVERDGRRWRLALSERRSTDAAGLARALGLQASANVELESILDTIAKKLSDATLLKL